MATALLSLNRTSLVVPLSRKVIRDNGLAVLKNLKAGTETAWSRSITRYSSSSSLQARSLLPKNLVRCSCVSKVPFRPYSSILQKSKGSPKFEISRFNIFSVQQVRNLPTLNQIRRQKPRTKKKRPKKEIPRDKRILLGPQRKGVCVKLVVRTPKKPNSAQRKCAVLRLSNGKLITAYIPGEKGVLQEHGVVLFEGGRVQDCPGIKYKIIRRKYDMN